MIELFFILPRRIAPRGRGSSPWGFVFIFFAVVTSTFASRVTQARGADSGWRSIFLSPPNQSWIEGRNANLDAGNPKLLVTVPGEGVLVSTKIGSKSDRNLQSRELFGDIELRLDFLLAKNSNAGVKLHGLYEVQLYDSHGVDDPDATHCGGIYPRAVRKPSYHHIDRGTSPLVNAAKPAGQWQSLLIRFRAPRFDDDGFKIDSAVFQEVRLNGKVVQRMTVVDQPTGAYWHLPKTPRGPIYLQGDHGPVAYRNVQVRPLASLADNKASPE